MYYAQLYLLHWVEHLEWLYVSLFSFFIIDSRPLSKCFRSNCTVSDISHNRFRFPDRTFPFPNKNMKMKMVKVFSRPLSSLVWPARPAWVRRRTGHGGGWLVSAVLLAERGSKPRGRRHGLLSTIAHHIHRTDQERSVEPMARLHALDHHYFSWAAMIHVACWAHVIACLDLSPLT